MSHQAEARPCRNCGRPTPADELDDAGWCPDCRAVLVRRATLWGRGVAVVVALALGFWIVRVVIPSPRFLIAWLALVAVIQLLAYKVVRRVAFEVVRSRGVPHPEH